jgi:hypothetical protein
MTPSSEYLNFFQKFAEIFASQGAPPVSMTPVSMTLAANFSKSLLVLLIPVANLLMVSTTSVANNVNNYQTADNFKKKFIRMLIR